MSLEIALKIYSKVGDVHYYNPGISHLGYNFLLVFPDTIPMLVGEGDVPHTTAGVQESNSVLTLYTQRYHQIPRIKSSLL